MSTWKLGVQLWTLRSEMDKSIENTLQKAAEQGFQGVEFSHVTYDGVPAAKIRAMLADFGLAPIARHLGSYGAITDQLDREIEFSKELGCPYVVFSLMEQWRRDTESAWAQSMEDLARAGERCAEQGIGLCYHNHDFELREQIGGCPSLDVLLDTISSDYVKAELDAGWIHYGGYDPACYIRKYAGRVQMVHLKDVAVQPDGSALTVELGKGEVNLTKVAAAASEAGAEWLIYEQDYTQNPPFQAMETSMDWIRRNILQR
ncbi:sugar phosphate isomerase/epimerase family protein [Paenibacillus beijingensis]|uniref:Xylose isomerase-like TIM barrel domain-containing protein n=1 Tax=Paenibacillus beijingensis TaxID=1126833 RepID=A0A0D5NFB5_9BACL|nr:sugar phosphate isomerase/epimerase family protein [Paenibacillus beijingensis]AJY74084.1 hypothetical protein VN24_05050 [Paenibacillus beijingensis]